MIAMAFKYEPSVKHMGSQKRRERERLESQSITVTFHIPCQYTHDIVHVVLLCRSPPCTHWCFLCGRQPRTTTPTTVVEDPTWSKGSFPPGAKINILAPATCSSDWERLWYLQQRCLLCSVHTLYALPPDGLFSGRWLYITSLNKRWVFFIQKCSCVRSGCWGGHCTAHFCQGRRDDSRCY